MNKGQWETNTQEKLRSDKWNWEEKEKEEEEKG